MSRYAVVVNFCRTYNGCALADQTGGFSRCAVRPRGVALHQLKEHESRQRRINVRMKN